ncbi:hypothetical protein ACSS6W_006331 [Trichoderma asperelloides]
MQLPLLGQPDVTSVLFLARLPMSSEWPTPTDYEADIERRLCLTHLGLWDALSRSNLPRTVSIRIYKNSPTHACFVRFDG